MVDARSPRALERLGSLVVALALALVVAAPASPAPLSTEVARPAAAVALSPSDFSPSHEAQFVSRINSLRASKGLSQLQVSGDLLSVARGWTEQMRQAGQISHNPNLGSQVPGAWTKLGENVGVGYEVDGLMQAFIDSPAHYRNLVDPDWTHVAVGVIVEPDGRIWTTHNFMALGSPSAPPPPPPPPAPPAPRSPAPPTTQAPRTDEQPAASPPPEAPAEAPVPAIEPTAARVSAVLDPLRTLEA